MGNKNYFEDDFDFGMEGYWSGGIYYPNKKNIASKTNENVAGATTSNHYQNAGVVGATHTYNYNAGAVPVPKSLFENKKVLDSKIRDFILMSQFEHILYSNSAEIPNTETNKIVYAANGIFELVENRFLKVSTKIGEFHFPGFKKYEESLELKIPKIPRSLIDELIALDRGVYTRSKGEFYAAICYNFVDEKYHIRIPKQEISGASVTFDKIVDSENEVMVLDHHSHNVMGAFFSGTDNNDDAMARLKISAVFGTITQQYPTINCRVIINGVANTINIDKIIQPTKFEEDLDSTVNKLFEDKIVAEKIYKVNTKKIPAYNSNMHLYATSKKKNVNQNQQVMKFNQYTLDKIKKLQDELVDIIKEQSKLEGNIVEGVDFNLELFELYEKYKMFLATGLKLNLDYYVKINLRSWIYDNENKSPKSNINAIATALIKLLNQGGDAFAEICIEELKAKIVEVKPICIDLIEDLITTLEAFDEHKIEITLITELEAIAAMYDEIDYNELINTISALNFITFDIEYDSLDQKVGELIHEIFVDALDTIDE